MRIITESIPYIQIALSIILIALVLLQQSEADLGGAFGGSESLNTPAYTRRGFERFVFNSTILIGILFAISSLVAIVVR